MEKSLNSPISIYALGGLDEVGKNMYCFENDDSIVIIDCGVRFPGVDLPGINYLVPDFTHLKNNRNKIRALIVTHGHEDHIGGIPFLIQTVNVPFIYAPRLACALIKNKLEENKLDKLTKVLEYDSDTAFKIGNWGISFFRVTHSIPDSYGVVIDTPEGRVVSTGDFKIDLTPIGPDIELSRITKLGDEGIDLLLSDSTNAEHEGYTPSEKNVYDSVQEIFDKTKGRIIVSTFSSNISRIQQICEVAVQHNRKIVIIGRSMERAVEISRNFGYIKIKDSSIIDSKDIRMFKPNELLILCTGSQGESMAALSRIASGDHKDVKIIPGDTVVFSSSAIPGNGIMIDHVANLLTRCGAEVITNSTLLDIHSSGHPSKQELRLMLKLARPKYFMPMHGDFRMLKLHAELATAVGVPQENTFVLDNGDCLQLFKHKVTRSYQVEHGITYIDGKDIRGLAEAVIEDRKKLTDDGLVTIVLSIYTKNNKLLCDPQIFGKGFIIQNKKKDMDGCAQVITKIVKDKLYGKVNFAELKAIIRDTATVYFHGKAHSKPMIIPVIMAKN